MCTDVEKTKRKYDDDIEDLNFARDENGEMLVSDGTGRYAFSTFDLTRGRLIRKPNPENDGYILEYKLYTLRELYFNKLMNISIWIYEEYLVQRDELTEALKKNQNNSERLKIKYKLIDLYNTHNKKIIEFKRYQKLFNNCTK